MTLNSCLVTCQERTVSLFFFWILLTRSMYSCFLTLFFKTAKNRKKKKKQTRKAEQSFLLSPNFFSRWGEGRPQESLCVLLSWLLVLLPSSAPSVNADLSEHCSLSFEGWLPQNILLWRLLSSRQRQLHGKCGVAGLGHSQPALLNSSVYIGKHSAELRGWRGEINAREAGGRALRMEKS